MKPIILFFVVMFNSSCLLSMFCFEDMKIVEKWQYLIRVDNDTAFDTLASIKYDVGNGFKKCAYKGAAFCYVGIDDSDKINITASFTTLGQTYTYEGLSCDIKKLYDIAKDNEVASSDYETMTDTITYTAACVVRFSFSTATLRYSASAMETM